MLRQLCSIRCGQLPPSSTSTVRLNIFDIALKTKPERKILLKARDDAQTAKTELEDANQKLALDVDFWMSNQQLPPCEKFPKCIADKINVFCDTYPCCIKDRVISDIKSFRRNS